MNKKIISLLSILVLVTTTLGSTLAFAQYDSNGQTNDFFQSLLNLGAGPTIKNLIETYNEIQEAKQELRALAESYGIELPELTKDQKQEIMSTFRELRRNGHPRDEVRSEIIDLLIDYGWDLPDLTKEQREEIKEKTKTMLSETYGFVFIDLTPEQKAYLKQTIIQMNQQGLTREEIRNEIITLYEKYGGVIPDITEEEKESIHDWIHDMIETDYNIDLPDLTSEQRQEFIEKKEEIHQLQRELREQFKQANRLTRYRFLRYVRKDLMG